MSIPPLLNGPIPPFNNPTIEPGFFEPSQFVISALSFGQITTVTTSVNHNYVVGQLVRLLIPSSYGSIQLNEKTGFVISVPTTNSVVIGINSTGTNPFIASPTFLPFQSRTQPQIVAAGNQNSGQLNASGRSSVGTFIPGSFINISPA